MKGKMKKILGLAISAAMAVSAVMPWTGVTAFAEGETITDTGVVEMADLEPATDTATMETDGTTLPTEEPATEIENDTETLSWWDDFWDWIFGSKDEVDTQDVYVYVKNSHSSQNAVVNDHGYYTVGKITLTLPDASEKYSKDQGKGDEVYNKYADAITEALKSISRYEANSWLDLEDVNWYSLHTDSGADDYVSTGWTWHLDGAIKEDVQKYTVTFDANGGSFQDDSTTVSVEGYLPGEDIDTSSVADPKKTDWNFLGWSFDPLATEPGHSFVMPESDVTLYAVWELAGESAPDTFTVQYKWSSATDGKALPAELNESLPVDTAEYVLNSETGYYEPDLKVDETYTKGSTFKAEDGTWTFSGWSVSTPPDENGVVAIEGTWTFEADEEPPVVEPGDDNVTIDKTATGLVDDTTDVTLSIGADEETTASDVVFVLDKSASLDIRNEAMNMLDELKGRVDEGHIINVGVVNFEKGVLQKLDLTPFTEENRTTIEKSVTYSNSESSGTNIHGALAAGKAMLDADDSVSDSNKHLVLVTDGVGYLWGADPAGNNVYSIYSESIANGEENLYASPETMAWHHTGSDYYNEFLDMENWYTENGSDIENDINTYGILFEEGQYQAKNYGITSGQGRDTDWSKIPKFIEENSYVPDESLLSTASASDAAMYMVAQVWNEIASEYNAYAYADPRYSKAHPWAYTAISNLGDLGGFSSVIPETKEEYSGMFDAVKSSVLYEIEEGTVTDVIGEDFDFAGMDTLTLTVSGVALERTSIEGTTAIFGDGYEVTYTNENGTETLVWEIKVPVEEGKGVALTYTLNLVNKSTTPGSYEVPTNEEAVLDYTSTTGAENQKEFPVPEVTYTVADTSEPSDPGPDNPPYIPDGGDEEEPSEPTEEIPEEETPQTSLPTDDTSVPDAIPGEPSAPSTEEIPDNTTPQTAQPPQTGARAAGSVVLLAGAAVVAALTLRRKK